MLGQQLNWTVDRTPPSPQAPPPRGRQVNTVPWIQADWTDDPSYTLSSADMSPPLPLLRASAARQDCAGEAGRLGVPRR